MNDIKDRLYSYIRGILNEHDAMLIAIGGTTDHLHLLIELPAPLPLSDSMRFVKTNSSKWIHETFPQHNSFGWQSGYAAFSVSCSAVEEVCRYIDHQEEHHRSKTFEEEIVDFLQRHKIKYDDRYLWD